HDLLPLREWAAKDVRAAADWVSRLPPGLARQDALTTVAVVWANQDIAEAASWVRALPEPGEQAGGLETIAYEAARTQSLTALNLALELPAGDSRDELITHAVAQWAATDPAAAAQW